MGAYLKVWITNNFYPKEINIFFYFERRIIDGFWGFFLLGGGGGGGSHDKSLSILRELINVLSISYKVIR